MVGCENNGTIDEGNDQSFFKKYTKKRMWIPGYTSPQVHLDLLHGDRLLHVWAIVPLVLVSLSSGAMPTTPSMPWSPGLSGQHLA